MGVFRDKQYDAIAKRMAPMAREIVAMETPDNPRALPAEELGEVLKKYQSPEHVHVAGSLEEALQLGEEAGEKRRCDRGFWFAVFYRRSDKIKRKNGIGKRK